MNTVVTKAVERVLEFVYPALCIVCNGSCVEDNSHICHDCMEVITHQHKARSACGRCGQDEHFGECSCQYAWDEPYESIMSACNFTDEVQRIVHAFKYRGMRCVARHMGVWAGSKLQSHLAGSIDMVCPVPLHLTRRLRRGYNQAALFSQGICCVLGNDIRYEPRVLMRKRHTHTQTTFSRAQRRKNLAGAFSINRHKAGMVKERRILLVDDVVTTGATVRSCTDALLAAGCRSVRVLSLARG